MLEAEGEFLIKQCPALYLTTHYYQKVTLVSVFYSLSADGCAFTLRAKQDVSIKLTSPLPTEFNMLQLCRRYIKSSLNYASQTCKPQCPKQPSTAHELQPG